MLKINNIFNFTLIVCFLIILFSLLIICPSFAQSDQQKNIEESKISIGDEVSIFVERYEAFSKTLKVDNRGKLQYLPMISIQAEGLTPSQLQSQIEYVLQPYVSSPKVSVSVKKAGPIVKVGDMLNIIVKGYDNYNQTVEVQNDGSINYQNFGAIKVGGLKISEIKQVIEDKLKKIISKPEVIVSISPDDYVLKYGDIVSLSVLNNPKYDYKSKINQNGMINHPILGELKVSGKTVNMIKDQVTELLKAYITNPEVNISVEQGIAITEEPAKPEEKEPQKPEEKEFLLNYGDLLSIIVKDHNEYNFDVVVQPDGKILHPNLGEFKAYGLTKSQITQNILTKLGSYISNPLVTVIIKGKVDLIEMSADESTDYVFKVGDVVQVQIENRKNYDYTMVVQPNGKVYYPPLGEMNVVGKSIAMIKNEISSKLPFKINSNQISVNIRQFKGITEEPLAISDEFPFALRRFGFDFFESAKKRILKAEENNQFIYNQEKVTQKNAISGFVGPLDMMNANVQATVPDKYILGPGDRINITYWTDVVEPKTESLTVDEKGEVTIEKLGKLVVRGMTLPQFEEAVKAGLSRVAYKNLQLIATLDELRSIQIFITGEVFRPGSYAVSAVTTVANALYMCGGPNENGSLRDIKLIRRNETKSIDFYKFLMKGDSSQDYTLESGDTIMVPLVGKTVTISGEVKRPAIYELKADENLKELIAIAGNIRPTGYIQRIRIDSVNPSRERIIIDVDMTNPDQTDSALFDGDTVTIFSIPAEKMNTVNIEGKIRMPGTYQLKDGMKVSDLIRSAQGLLEEAYMERADLIRFNPDKKTTSLIPVDLSKVLSGVDDIKLNQWDKLIVYSKWDIRWVADRVVDVHGAVQRPGSYERSDGMKIFDLLIKCGGVLPNAYLDRALLFRRDNTNRITKSIPINLDLAIKKDERNNIDLYDGDILVVHTIQEARWEPKREVAISGAVQNPGNFIRTDGMKISDLVKSAGGILPNTYLDKAFLLRLDERQRTTIGFSINLKLAMQNDPNNDLELKDGDELIVYTYEQARWEPKKQVTISGAVQKSGVYQKTDGMRISDLIFRAGGVLPNAYLERANIERFVPNEDRYMIIPINLAKSLAGEESFNLLLEDEDILRVYTLEEAEYRPDNIVTIYGAVQKPDKYNRFINMKLSDLLFIAGGLLPGASKTVELSRINELGTTTSISVDITDLLKGDKSNDPELKDGDIVFVRKDKDFLDALKIVKISGEIKYPGTYVIKKNERLSELIKRAGGLTDRACLEASVITRRTEYLVQDEQEKSLRQVGSLFEELADQEYKREYTQAWLQHSAKFVDTKSNQPSQSIAGIIAESTGMGSLAETSQTAANIQELRQFQYTMVTPARKIKSLLPSGRLLIDVSQALSVPGSKDDIILENGDTIFIPTTPSTVTVSGAVVQPSSLTYVKGKKLKHYITDAGGYAKDADIESVYVVKANGMVVKGKDARIAPGDIIIVPTKVIVQKVTDRWGQFFSVIRFSIGAFVSLYMVKILVDRL